MKTETTPERCPICGYTEKDEREFMDHYLCQGWGHAPWDKIEKKVMFPDGHGDENGRI